MNMEERKSLIGKMVLVIDVFENELYNDSVKVFTGYVRKIDDTGVFISYENNSKNLFNGEEKKFIIDGIEKYNCYSFFDFGKLYFNSAEKAFLFSKTIPRKNDILYTVSEDYKICRVKVKSIKGLPENNHSYYFDLYIVTDSDESYSISDVGTKIFFSKHEARQKIETIK